MVYTVASPDEYLAITGAGVKTLKICKSAWVWPLQRCQRFSIQPRDYSMNLQAMTKEKLQFLLPVVFTVGPDVNQRGASSKNFSAFRNIPGDGSNSKGKGIQSDDDPLHDVDSYMTPEQAQAREDKGDALMKYAMLLAEAETKKDVSSKGHHVENIVKGIIEGETRVLVSSMTMEDIFTGREAFKRHIFKNIQSELAQFGLKIYNANVKELRDAPQSNYFESLSRKAHEGAVNQARVDVAEAQRLGNVGEAQRLGEQEREIARINAQTAVQKTELDSERAQAEATLATRKTGFNRDVSIAQIEATRTTEGRDEELRKAVEIKRAQTELERLRASDVVKATILRESKQQAADATNYEEQARANAARYSKNQAAEAAKYEEQKRADAHAYQVGVAAEAKLLAAAKEAEAELVRKKKAADAESYKINVEAEAKYIAATKEAEAELVRQTKAAAGLSAMAGAYKDLSEAFGGPAGLVQFLMIEKDIYTKLAKSNAEAVRGLNPKMTIWNTGAQSGKEIGDGSGMGGVESIRNMYQMLPPLMTTIKEQTGVAFPEWQFGTLANQMSEQETQGKQTNGMTGKLKGASEVGGKN